VEGGALERPPWLNIAVHVANSGVAWADLLVGEGSQPASQAICQWCGVRRLRASYKAPVQHSSLRSRLASVAAVSRAVGAQ
jgi:hypothetical protein